MSKLLIAFASNEGQTARVADALARRLVSAGHDARVVRLAGVGARPDVGPYDGVILAASVHAGTHQGAAMRFALENVERLRARPSAFLSISLSAAASDETGRRRAVEQSDAFLRHVGWEPDLVETVAGAVRTSALPPALRWVVSLGSRLFAEPLRRMGWPDLGVDREFTDWDALGVFALHYLALLERRAGQTTPGSARSTTPTSRPEEA